MTPATPTDEKESTSRIDAFSDGIFSVAITLLAIDLKAPVLESVSDRHLMDFILERWPEYMAVLSSFASVLLLWISHHQVFKLIGKVDVSLMLSNGLLLLFIVGVPYPTSTMARYILTDASRYAAAFYAGYFVLVNVAFRFLWYSVTKNRRLLKRNVSDQTIRAYSKAFSVGIPAYLVIALFAFISPVGSVMLCNAMWIYWSIASVNMHTIA